MSSLHSSLLCPELFPKNSVLNHLFMLFIQKTLHDMTTSGVSFLCSGHEHGYRIIKKLWTLANDVFAGTSQSIINHLVYLVPSRKWRRVYKLSLPSYFLPPNMASSVSWSWISSTDPCLVQRPVCQLTFIFPIGGSPA